MESFKKRRAWFKEYLDNIEGQKLVELPDLGFVICPCCGYPTLGHYSMYECCPICFWEEDQQDDETAHEVWGGPNWNYSLFEARSNFQQYLTMFRPDDAHGDFERHTTPNKIKVKKQIVALFKNAIDKNDPKLMVEFKSLIKKL